MAIGAIEPWERSVIAMGRIAQDGDTSISPNEAEANCLEYIQLVESVEGSEGVRGATALVRSIQVQEDYEVYECTIRKLFHSFPPDVVAQALIGEMPRLIATLPDRAGDFLSLLTRAGDISASLTRAFNALWRASDATTKICISSFIHAQKIDGSLEDRKGVLGV